MNEEALANGLWFSIQIEQDEFLAFVSADVLCIHFNASKAAKRVLMQAYRKHQRTIDEAARRKFIRGAPRPVQLSVGDF